MRFCCQVQETRLRKNIGKSVELGRSLRFFTIQRITAYHLASPRRVSNAIMYFIELEKQASKIIGKSSAAFLQHRIQNHGDDERFLAAHPYRCTGSPRFPMAPSVRMVWAGSWNQWNPR